MSGVETRPDCGGTGIISRPYIAGVVSTMTACTCDAGREARHRLIIAPPPFTGRGQPDNEWSE